jgi:hypothetical protein
VVQQEQSRGFAIQGNTASIQLLVGNTKRAKEQKQEAHRVHKLQQNDKQKCIQNKQLVMAARTYGLKRATGAAAFNAPTCAGDGLPGLHT